MNSNDFFAAVHCGYGVMDVEHDRLASLLIALDAQLAAGSSDSDILQALQGLLTETLGHFNTEKRLMTAYDYPEAQTHMEAHDSLLKDMLVVVEDFKAGAYRGKEKAIAQYARFWLTEHIARLDRPLADYLNRQKEG